MRAQAINRARERRRPRRIAGLSADYYWPPLVSLRGEGRSPFSLSFSLSCARIGGPRGPKEKTSPQLRARRRARATARLTICANNVAPGQRLREKEREREREREEGEKDRYERAIVAANEDGVEPRRKSARSYGIACEPRRAARTGPVRSICAHACQRRKYIVRRYLTTVLRNATTPR